MAGKFRGQRPEPMPVNRAHVNDPAEFVDTLAGRECRALLAQELWHHGAPSDLVNVLYLHMSDGRWARFFFDAGVFFWREATPEPITGGEPVWEFRLTDVGERFGVCGQRIEQVRFTQPDRDCARLAIVFERGTLVLDNADDRSRLVFVDAA
jgi:hypothetical protein